MVQFVLQRQPHRPDPRQQLDPRQEKPGDRTERRAPRRAGQEPARQPAGAEQQQRASLPHARAPRAAESHGEDQKAKNGQEFSHGRSDDARN